MNVNQIRAEGAMYASSVSCSDAELASLIAAWPAPQLNGFVEGPFSAGFDSAALPGAAKLSELWTVRVFDETGEIYARRTGFDEERPWQVRVIGAKSIETATRSEQLAAGGLQEILLDEKGEKRMVVQHMIVEHEEDQPLIRWLRLESTGEGGSR